jgi:predicted RNA binding protein YcfA (HicA-like mRNA interferase family)
VSRKDKLFERLKQNPNDCTFAELRTLLVHEGFELVRTSGSHSIFTRDEVTFVIPVHNKRVKSVYVKRVIALIEESRKDF